MRYKVCALEKALAFELFARTKHIVMSNGARILTIPRSIRWTLIQWRASCGKRVWH